MSIFTRMTVRPSTHEQIATEPIDVIVRNGKNTEVIPNVTRVWISHDGNRQTFRSNGQTVRTSISGPARHNGKDYPYRPIIGLVHRESGKYITVEEAQKL